jgi:hypothetical protein
VLESFGDVADFVIDAEGGSVFGVGSEDEDSGLGHGKGVGNERCNTLKNQVSENVI